MRAAPPVRAVVMRSGRLVRDWRSAAAAIRAAAVTPRPPGTTPLPPPGTVVGTPARLVAAPAPPPIDASAASRSGMFAEDVSFSYASLLAEIVALGATHVALVVPIYQTDGTSHDLRLDTRLSPTLATIAETVRAAPSARTRGDVVPDHAPVGARARAVARHPGAQRSRRLVPHYGDLIGELAAAGAMTGAKRLVVGSELSSLDGRSGPLASAGREASARFFPASSSTPRTGITTRPPGSSSSVDEDGISGYFNLRDGAAPADDATLEAGWRRARRADRRLARRPDGTLHLHRARLPIAHRSLRRALGRRSPGGTPDLEEQRRAFAAFRRVWATAPPALGRRYIWNWYGFGGLDTTSYTPRGKPAELRSALTARRAVAPATLGNQLPRGARAAARSDAACRLVCAPSRVNRRRFTRAGAPVFRILMRARSGFGSDRIDWDRIRSGQDQERIRKSGATERVNRPRFTRGGAQTRAWRRRHRGPGDDGARNGRELSRESDPRRPGRHQARRAASSPRAHSRRDQ